MYLTIEDKGTCSRIESVEIWYYKCVAISYPEAFFPATIAPSSINGSITINGTCSGSSAIIPSGIKPTAKCESDGTWTNYVNNCPCKAGQERRLTICEG